MMGERYIFLNLVLCLQDLHLVDLEDFKYAGTNLTAFRLVDPDNADVRVSRPGPGRRVEGEGGGQGRALRSSSQIIHFTFLNFIFSLNFW